MDRDVLRVFKIYQLGAGFARRSGRRAAIICLVALFATGIWAIILYFGGWALGYSMDAAWPLPVLGGIFLLLVLGLSMAAMATSGTPDVPRDAQRDSVTELPQRRRRFG
jgi:fatty acid desaturase